MSVSAAAPVVARRRARGWQGPAWAGVLLVLAAVWLLPAVWMAVTSLKPTENIVRVPPEWIPWPATLAHYGEVLFSSSRTARIGRAFLNSVIVSVGTVVLVLITSAMAAYPLARMRFPGRDLVFVVLVGSLMIPNAVVLVPQYVLTQRLGWLSTYQGLIIPEAAVTLAFGVFLLRQFFLTIPGELEDAARIDGAGPLQIFRRVMMPLAANGVVVVFILSFVSHWGEYLLARTLTNQKAITLPVAIAGFQPQGEWYFSTMTAAYLLMFGPAFVVLAVIQRWFMKGLTEGAIKW